jgi:hypothetical protein
MGMVSAKTKCMNHENHIHYTKALLKRFLQAALALGAVASAHAVQVNLGWDASPGTDVAGYHLKYGTETQTYTQTVTVTSGTTATVSGLSGGVTYYFVVTAFNQDGIDSDPSNEAVFQTTNAAPTVSLNGAANGGSFHAPATVTLSATASDTDGSVTKVEFYVGAQKVGESTTAPYTVNVSAAVAGDYNFTAVAFDNSGASAQAAGAFQVRQLAVASTKRNANGTFELTINGAAGHTAHIWVSEDLKTWTLLQDVSNTNGSVVFTDTDAANYSQRFYKISAD